MTACGCTIKLTDDKWTEGMADFHADIVFCPLHAHAEELRDALKDMTERMRLINGKDDKCLTSPSLCPNHHAISRAEILLALYSKP